MNYSGSTALLNPDETPEGKKGHFGSEAVTFCLDVHVRKEKLDKATINTKITGEEQGIKAHGMI